ncbi:hypothetical protein [Alkalihalobacillus sp. AL-G]|uniref:hypothetical protein n=1 Tax=Alkalihalobacillus sp. AL-G TaxID=2926399 RepID=UPI00272C422D|nr:hypothetical protein [Alkalihalobacillus sp. AL-G]WLD92628.1 hypothetical protein MOJ78_16660 [Alkalihalobacillus sp. AL-G]
MKRFAKSVIPFLIVMSIVVYMMDFGDGEIGYEIMTYDSLPEKFKQNYSEIGPDGKGMFEFNGHTYITISTEPGEKVEVLFVGNAQDGIGKEIRYKVVKRGNGEEAKVIHGSLGDFTLCVVRLEKIVSTPFGFMKD